MPRLSKESLYDRPLSLSGPGPLGELLGGSGTSGHVGSAVTAQLNSQGESGLVGTLGWQIIQVPSGDTVTGYERSTSGITEAPAGSGTYYVTFLRPSPAGDYAIVWDAGGQYAEEAFTTTALPVSAPAPADMCSAWITASDVATAYDPTATDTTIYADDALAAIEVLNQLSAGQYPGTCTTTVRPCRDPCGCWGSIPARWNVYTFVWTGSLWANDCGDTCGCGVTSRIRLPDYPVVSVDEVRIDGVLIDPTTYRLDSQRYLVRLNDAAWPSCQNMSAPAGTLGSFTVEYTFGAEPPTIGLLAAKELAYELYLAGSPACRLPAATQSVTRQGVTYQTASTITATLGKGNTGLAYVDAFLSTVNPNGWNHRPYTWSPDRREVRTIGG